MSEIDEGLLANEEVITRTSKHWFAPAADSKWAILDVARRRRARVDRAKSGLGRIPFVHLADRRPHPARPVPRRDRLDRLQRHRLADRRIRRDDAAGPRPRGPPSQAEHGHAPDVADRRAAESLVPREDPRLRESPDHHRRRHGRLGQLHDDEGRRAFKKTILEQKQAAGAAPTAPAAPAQSAPAPAPTAAASSPAQGPMAAINELAKLRDSGAISDAEFEAKKAELLARI